ncbi:MAG: hypothetical protein ACYC7E_16765 [Armatimonadota bacterium]
MSNSVQAAETQIVLRDYLNQPWTNELLTYPFSAPKGACDARSVTLTGPRGAVPVQLSEIECWPETRWVKTAKLSFIADLAPLAADPYTVRIGAKPAAPGPATDLTVTPGKDQVEITTKGFGARLLLGEQTYPHAVSSDKVPGPVVGMRLADGTWFGGSRMYGPGKLKAYSATLTDRGPVFARVAVRYIYENGNTLDLTMRVAAGDNTIRCETRVKQDQPNDGFRWVLSRGLPPLIFQVQMEWYTKRDVFLKAKAKVRDWGEISLRDYPAGVVTYLTPWDEWWNDTTQRTIRLKLENTTRELQLHSLDPGVWVEPIDILGFFNPKLNPDPLKGTWAGVQHKLLPLTRDPDGEVYLPVNAAAGVRKWTLSDALSAPGVGAVAVDCGGPKPPAGAGPTVGHRLDEVKDYVLSWPGDAGKHPRLFLNRQEVEAVWKDPKPDPALLANLLQGGSAASPDRLISAIGSPPFNALGAYLLTGTPEVATKTQLVARVRKAVQSDPRTLMMVSGQVCCLYDAVVDGPLLSEAERSVLRAQMAYLGYGLADPTTWSAERGYASNNSNMTVNFVLGQGLVACTIPEHPMAKTWYRTADRMMEQFMSSMVGPAGEWPEALGGHGLASVAGILTFAIASSNAGFHDWVNDPRLKRLMLYQAKMHAPRDPRPRGQVGQGQAGERSIPALGRDSISGNYWALSGMMARATLRSDPAYSAILQWTWLESGAGRGTIYKLGGFEYLYCTPDLPATPPAWPSEVLPNTGAILRHGLGTPDEHQVMLISGDHDHTFYPSHTGSFPHIFAYGTPVAGAWPGGYEFQDELLTCHVTLARGLGTLAERKARAGYAGSAQGASAWSWQEGPPARFGEHGGLGNVSAFSTLPRQDYAAVDVAFHYPRAMNLDYKTDLPEWPPILQPGKTPVDWRRQTLFLKDDDPTKVNYLLIRDSIKGGQPTMWQMWTVSEMLDTPEKAKDVAAVLASKPGTKILPARELKGDRFTAIGQFGVDVEYYIAAPTGTPRHTLRWGTNLIDWVNKLVQPEYQDLLHLQLPGDGAYYVAFFPRKRNTPAPVFSRLGGGTIIKTEGDFGKDYGFLSALEAEATSGEGANFKGTAGSVQDRASGRVLSLGAKGEVRYRSITLAADFPASLRVQEKVLTVELPATIQPPAFKLAEPFPGGTLTVTAPGEWALAKVQAGVTLEKTAAGWSLTVPAGARAVELISQ